jgi:hypothetical protein
MSETESGAPDVLDALRHGLPISLLVDLAEAQELDSAEAYHTEQADTSWIPTPERGRRRTSSGKKLTV